VDYVDVQAPTPGDGRYCLTASFHLLKNPTLERRIVLQPSFSHPASPFIKPQRTGTRAQESGGSRNQNKRGQAGRLLLSGCFAAMTAFVAGSAQAASILIRHAVARVTMIPESRSDIKVEVILPNASLPLGLRILGERTVLEGDLGRKIRSCNGFGATSSVTLRGGRTVRWQDMPQVVIRTPRDATVSAAGAVFGTVGRSSSLQLDNSGCGDWTIANVEGAARFSQAGSGDTRMGSSGRLRVRVAGSGGVAAGAVKSGLDITIAGSGSARVNAASGPVDISVVGSGDVVIGSGAASDLQTSIAGSGDVTFQGTAAILRARITGSGDIRVRAVTGDDSQSVMGSGSVHIGN